MQLGISRELGQARPFWLGVKDFQDSTVQMQRRVVTENLDMSDVFTASERWYC